MAMSVTYGTFAGHVVYENRGGTESSYMRDPLGNTVGLMGMNGKRTDSWSYWPYGEIQNHGGSPGNSVTPLTFLGTLGYFADFLNQLYVRARYLRTDLTRWLSIDRLFPTQLAYVYGGADPVRIVDPTGAHLLWLLLLVGDQSQNSAPPPPPPPPQLPQPPPCPDRGTCPECEKERENPTYSNCFDCCHCLFGDTAGMTVSVANDILIEAGLHEMTFGGAGLLLSGDLESNCAIYGCPTGKPLN